MKPKTEEYEALRKERAVLVVKLLRNTATTDEEQRVRTIDLELDRIEDELFHKAR